MALETIKLFCDVCGCSGELNLTGKLKPETEEEREMVVAWFKEQQRDPETCLFSCPGCLEQKNRVPFKIS